ncbi:MAG TPA: type III secretion system export apparatus subunit SctV [Magnetospirillum sp.]|nr:type III secretion system export apparatus subunit SctV [Magnetospirillum sp.]
MDKVTRLLNLATQRNDIVLAVLLVAIIFMMILPLPTTLVDALIAINMALAAILLMVAMYIPSPLSFSAFPAVLLVTTLFRLALSISTTRLILLRGDAGKIVQTFGNFVVGGNLVVGLVVFLILTIVQFVVITKGAERVAEVGARFSLDAMPGKQMSIDGDMRAGVIDMDEARRRRGMVEKESQLYGAMDGAMKFVKGDAIAGLIIVAVNLLGGITIGTLQRGMEVGKAMQTYSILTIGDGLIGQIPALFISICAGIIVTRVSNDDGPSNVGSDIGSQILSQPRALMIGSGIMLGFSLIPGMPTAIFLVLSAVIGSVGYILHRSSRLALAEGDDGVMPAMAGAGQPTQRKPSSASEAKDEVVLTVPLLLDVSAEFESVLKAGILNEELLKIRRALYYDLGVPFPGIHLRYSHALPSGGYAIMLNEVPVSQGTLRPGNLFVRERATNLKTLGIEYATDTAFLPNLPTVWVPDGKRDLLSKAGIGFMDQGQVLTYHLAYVLKKYAEDFIGIQETRYLLASMESRFPDLVKEVQRVLPLQKITEILQRLVSEDISIRNLRTILESLIDWGQKEKDTVLLAEYVRSGLRRYISYKYSSGHNMLPAYMFAPKVEDTVRNAVRQTSGGSYLALDTAVSRKLVENVKKMVGDLSASAQKPVLLTSMDIRRYIRKLIELELYDLPVLSYQELTQDINIQPLGRIDL